MSTSKEGVKGIQKRQKSKEMDDEGSLTIVSEARLRTWQFEATDQPGQPSSASSLMVIVEDVICNA